MSALDLAAGLAPLALVLGWWRLGRTRPTEAHPLIEARRRQEWADASAAWIAAGCP